MRQAIIPFLGYCILQLCVGAVGLNLEGEGELGVSGILRSWVLGQMLLFAALQLLAVPMILTRQRFGVLFWSFTAAAVVLLCLGVAKIRKIKIRRPDIKKLTPFAAALLAAILILVGVQCYKYFFMMHLDEDDARWLAEANDAIEYGDMMTRDYDTGDYLGAIQVAKDAASPWSMMTAVLSRLLRTGTAVFAHTIYPPIELLLMYAVYWLIGTELFEKLETRLTFLLCVVVLNLFFGTTIYTQSTFSLVRIWQGKATVAGVVLPLLLYLFIRLWRRDTAGRWLALVVTCCAACLMSGMGISFSAVVIAVCGACYIVANKKWNRIPWLVASVLPSCVCLLVYTMFQSLF